MKKVLLDTNPILRFLLNDIPAQAQKTNGLFENAKAGKIKIIIPQIIIFEAYFVLAKYYEFDKKTIINYLQFILSTPYLIIEDRSVFLKSIAIFSSKNISFVDSFLVAKSTLENIVLFTFDKKLAVK
ncbi:hypothetical protein A2382_02735 [Candidatus Woesebacteria bacterium RIFOXYB1_FULL_38_16]|uniref:PIN domain-containing protein n=1 Tax=Candidatus Woesebacteria bacterium RIFOXYB1_FULL_38_16 TaxID=1802538 RepID=A0A1F8CS15_9BACT|nr:MAG: hypothetical protein A2191_03800 [Candidatus Woesebacteria bacterium RIFOXYA1_FULL_38_9]OGM79127.1 MAG: hypothetical protein A2382_02735 [Candidatus Woesebacteria bacterium RIFOXYB1_FULL_38_16]